MFNIKIVTEIGSTHYHCKNAIINGKMQHGDVLQALKQTEGRGQKNRSWLSGKGDQLAFTLVLNPKLPLSTTKISNPPLQNNIPTLQYQKNRSYSQISYVASVAMGNVLLDQKNNIQLGFKWINDILIDSRKVCGILCSLVNVKDDLFVLVSAGMNIESKPEINDDKISASRSVSDQSNTTNITNCEGNTAKFGITCLKDHDIKLSSYESRDKFLYSFAELYNIWHREGFRKISALWNQRDILYNKYVEIENENNDIFCGKYCGMTDDGAIVINSNNDSDASFKIMSGNIKNFII